MASAGRPSLSALAAAAQARLPSRPSPECAASLWSRARRARGLPVSAFAADVSPPPAAPAAARGARGGFVRYVATRPSGAPPHAAGETAPSAAAPAAVAKRERKGNKAVKEYLFGLNCVGAALAANRRALYKLTVCQEIEDCEVANSDAYQQIKRTVAELKIPVETKRECYFQNAGVDDPKQVIISSCSEHAEGDGTFIKLPSDCPPAVMVFFQGMMLAVGPLDTIKITMLNSVQKGEPYSAVGKLSDIRYKPRPGVWPLWLALDRIVDPTNFGVILRYAPQFALYSMVWVRG
ncbi:MAG: hypothetical protein BJ554DRAFT_6837 [Olpidium bornovanus]|uniref:Uncharacterized protein n=1 Tax=Olpidium bornovanus TaxID=278681 RepID=A0A8H7ZX18_9FUNG|nr:MAG: hypothetical protein BJ554DRAFT_6837 [Olpidium bornovanus]